MQRLGRQALEQRKSGLAHYRRLELQSESATLFTTRQGGLHPLSPHFEADLKTRGPC